MTDNLEERALALIKTKLRGVLQSELWKELDIDSRKCSRVVAKLEAEGKVKRTWETVSGTRTYRLSYVETKKEVPKKEYRFDLIMAEDEVAPCVGCTYECEPDYCPDLGLWIELLAREEARKPSKVAPAEVEAAEEARPPVREKRAEIEAPAAKPAKAAKAAKKGKAVPEPEEEEEVVVKPARPAKKGKAVPEPEEEEEEEKPVKPARKGKKVPVPEEKPVKMAKVAARKGKAVPEPEEEEEEEEEKPAPKRKPVKAAKAAPKAPEEKLAKKAPAKKRK